MKHIILVLIALIAMFTFWRSIGGPLTAGEHKTEGAAEAALVPEHTGVRASRN
ncbi:MAG: hypothetical protein LBD20_00795 [Spirochaetaceae bacterium]|jgi:hypothetical protein|nr:hypothetical protein [Spirochaetaceae bacterium]